MAKTDERWIVFVGIVFLVVIGILMLAPRNYFQCKNEGFETALESSMAQYIENDTVEFDKKFAGGFLSPSTLSMSFSDGNEMLLARRCYQFTNLSACLSSKDPAKKNRCSVIRDSIKVSTGSLGFDKIDSTLDSVANYFDDVAAGTNQAINIKCTTYKIFTDKFADIRQMIMSDIEKARDTIASPLKGSVYVLLFQAPFWQNAYKENIVASNPLSTTTPYFDLINTNPDKNIDAQTDKILFTGRVFNYVVIMYGGYDRSNRLYAVDQLDNSPVDNTNGRKVQTNLNLLAKLDDLYMSKDGMCMMQCINDNNIHCGCASMPVAPKTKPNGEPYFGINYLNSGLDKGKSYTPYLGYMINQTPARSNVVNTLPWLKSEHINGTDILPTSGIYQSRCFGPEFPDAYQKKFNEKSTNITTPSSFGMLYRVNPAYSPLGSTTFDIMPDK